jgi:Fe-S oxidoreductase
VGCPYCNIMLSDGIGERQAGEEMEVRDIAQILLESVTADKTSEGETSTARPDAGV